MNTSTLSMGGAPNLDGSYVNGYFSDLPAPSRIQNT